MLDVLYKFTKLVPKNGDQIVETDDPLLRKLMYGEMEFVERSCAFDMRLVWAFDEEVLPNGKECTAVDVGPKRYLLAISFNKFAEIDSNFKKKFAKEIGR